MRTPFLVIMNPHPQIYEKLFEIELQESCKEQARIKQKKFLKARYLSQSEIKKVLDIYKEKYSLNNLRLPK